MPSSRRQCGVLLAAVSTMALAVVACGSGHGMQLSGDGQTSGQHAWQIITEFAKKDSAKALSDRDAAQRYLETMCKVEKEVGSYAGFDASGAGYNDVRKALQEQGIQALALVRESDYTRQFGADSIAQVKGGKSYCQLAGR